MSKTVQFTINLNGNAVSGVATLTDKVNELSRATGKAQGAFAGLGKLGGKLMVFNQAFELIGKVVSKSREFVEANNAQQEAEAKLGQVMRNTMGATVEKIDSIKALASEQQKLGVIGDEVQLAGAQELGTYLEKTDSLKKLMPVMNDMLAQQYGLNASQEQAVQIGSMMGKVLEGQTGALSRYGYKFNDAQEALLKYGTEEQKVATLADVITQSVGGMNEALAGTKEGNMKQMANRWGDLKETIGNFAVSVESAVAPLLDLGMDMLENMLPVLDKVIGPLEKGIEYIVDELIPQIAPVLEQTFSPFATLFQTIRSNIAPLVKQFDGIKEAVTEHVVPSVQRVFAVVADIVGKLVEFISHSQIIKDLLDACYWVFGKIWDIVKVLVDAVDWVFNKVIMPALRGIEKFYKWITGRSGEDNDVDAISGASVGINDQLNQAVNTTPTQGGVTQPAAQKASAGANATVTGGSKSTTININLGKMVENIVFNGGLRENAQDMERQVTEIMYRVLAMAATV